MCRAGSRTAGRSSPGGPNHGPNASWRPATRLVHSDRTSIPYRNRKYKIWCSNKLSGPHVVGQVLEFRCAASGECRADACCIAFARLQCPTGSRPSCADWTVSETGRRRESAEHDSTARQCEVVRSGEGVGIHPSRGRQRGVRSPLRHPGFGLPESAGRGRGGARRRTSRSRPQSPKCHEARRRDLGGRAFEPGLRDHTRQERRAERLRAIQGENKPAESRRFGGRQAGPEIRRLCPGASDSRRADSAAAGLPLHVPALTKTYRQSVVAELATVAAASGWQLTR
jgi:hypothetical protein